MDEVGHRLPSQEAPGCLGVACSKRHIREVHEVAAVYIIIDVFCAVAVPTLTKNEKNRDQKW